MTDPERYLMPWKVLRVCNCQMDPEPHVHTDEPVWEPWEALTRLAADLGLKVEKPLKNRPWQWIISHQKGWTAQQGWGSVWVSDYGTLTDGEARHRERVIRELAAAVDPEACEHEPGEVRQDLHGNGCQCSLCGKYFPMKLNEAGAWEREEE